MRTTAATASLAELLKASPEWRQFFRQCCEAVALEVARERSGGRERRARSTPLTTPLSFTPLKLG